MLLRVFRSKLAKLLTAEVFTLIISHSVYIIQSQQISTEFSFNASFKSDKSHAYF